MKTLTEKQIQDRINLRTSKYWQKRFEYLETVKYSNDTRIQKEINRIIDRYIKDIDKEIKLFYLAFAEDNQISMAEAKKLLKGNELKEFKWDVREYIKKGQENSITGEWMLELKNASHRYRINRLESFKVRLHNLVNNMYLEEEQLIGKHMEDVYKEAYLKTAYEVQKGLEIGFPMHLDITKVVNLAAGTWNPDGLNFSERLWDKHRPNLVRFLEKDLSLALVKGENPGVLISKMSKQFDKTRSQVGNVLYTEASYIYSAGQKDVFKDLDVEQYEIVATLDTHTSDTCRELDGTVFKMSDYSIGATAPPFHWRCRTVTAPYIDDNIGQRIYRDANGHVGYVPSNMTYKEWYKEYVEPK